MTKMVSELLWQCPQGLIEQALAECPINDEVVVLNKHDGNFFYGNWSIKDEFKDTLWKQVLDTLPCSIGEARIITLASGESYQSHADIDNRWHLNLTGHQSFLIDLENQEMFKCTRNNHWYFMRTGRKHTACNFGFIPRLQLVVREPLRESRHFTNLISVSITQAVPAPENHYKFDNIFSPWLNQINEEYKMTDFSPSPTLVTFKMEAELKEELERIRTLDFVITYD
jgi:hypothetical protein